MRRHCYHYCCCIFIKHSLIIHLGRSSSEIRQNNSTQQIEHHMLPPANSVRLSTMVDCCEVECNGKCCIFHAIISSKHWTNTTYKFSNPITNSKIAQQTGKNMFIRIQFCPVTNLLTYFDLMCLCEMAADDLVWLLQVFCVCLLCRQCWICVWGEGLQLSK